MEECASPRDLVGKLIGPYKLLMYIGSGSYGHLFRAREMRTGRSFALKVFYSAEHTMRDWEREMEAYLITSTYPTCNAYILCLYDYFKARQPSGTIFGVSVFELMDGCVENQVRIHSLEEYLSAAWQLLKALSVLHDEHDIAHNDIHTGNIFYRQTQSFTLYKLGDLGVSCVHQLCLYMAHEHYVPPDAEKYTRKVVPKQIHKNLDVWCMGKVLVEFLVSYSLARAPIFHAQDPTPGHLRKLLDDSIVAITPTIENASVLRGLRGLILAMLNVDGSSRPTATGALTRLENIIHGHGIDIKKTIRDAREVLLSTEPCILPVIKIRRLERREIPDERKQLRRRLSDSLLDGMTPRSIALLNRHRRPPTVSHYNEQSSPRNKEPSRTSLPL